ncbi:hypothetical protein ACEPAI_4273 [Sanghuangporus weigelae]
MQVELTRTPFKRPPLDGSLTVPELYDWNYEHNKDYPLFVYEDGPGTLRTISMGQGVQGMHRATLLIRQEFPELVQKEVQTGQPVIAILAASDAVTFFCTLIGTLRTGVAIFLISPRNTPQAISFLLSQTKPIGIIVSSESWIQQLADNSLKLSAQVSLRRVNMPTFEDLFPVMGFDLNFRTVESASLRMSTPAIIYHSSGTASFPKPIAWTHQALYWVSIIPFSGESDVPGSIMGCHCVPFFHAMSGLPLTVPATAGLILAVFKPQTPAIVPNPVNVFEGSLATKAEYLLSPPTFFEHWSQTPKCVDEMSKMKGIVFGGGPLAKHAGDLLASEGVNVFQIYASTETLLLSEFLSKNPGMEWQYFRFNPNRKIYLEPFGDNQFRVVVVATENYRPVVINTTVDGVDAYATDDLVSPHPSEKDLFKVVGRADAQIIHSNGEKTNPGPLETILDQDSNIDKAIIFGRGRFQCGVLIQPSKLHSINPSDTSAVAKFRNMIWPTVHKVNSHAPSHSRIFKEMILVVSPDKPFEYTAKGTLRRQTVLEEYSSEINAMYDAVNESAQPEIDTPEDWSRSSVLRLTRTVIEQIMKKQADGLGDDDDMFEHGLDSLQATWVRNTFVRILRESHGNLVHNLSTNFVYDHPTMSAISDHIYAIITRDVRSGSKEHGAVQKELLTLARKYTGPLPEFTATPRACPPSRVVLITGSTGSFGSNLLAKFLQSDSVKLVFVLSRPSPDGTVDQRLVKAFEKEGLNVDLLGSSNLRLLEGDASKTGLGISIDQYNELLSSVTHVIHNGWRVNFKNSVSSFESNIRSVRNFVDFCLHCKGVLPARIIFISSIGIFRRNSSDTIEPEEPLGIENVSLESGYGQSKWISEEILHEASRNSASRITIIRPGQITGPSGSWNEHEWFPSLIKSSIFLNKLPAMDGDISWITSDVAAGAVLDMLDCKECILHLVHPRPVKWSQVIACFSKALDIPTVAPEVWIDALERSTSLENLDEGQTILDDNPASRLLKLFSSLMREKSTKFEPRLASEKAQKISNVLRNAESLNERNVEAWISKWKHTGFL